MTSSLTVKQAIAKLHSHASSTSTEPYYCGIFGLTGALPTGLVGFAPKKGGTLQMLSVGALYGSSDAGLPKVVQTAARIRLGSTVHALHRAYPHKLKAQSYYGDTLEILKGKHDVALAFLVRDGQVVNIATGKIEFLAASELCG